MIRHALALPLVLALCACSTRGAENTVRMTGNSVADAVAAPLKDLNLVKDEMPEILELAVKDAYRKPERDDCSYIGWEVRQLDLALGPDLDMPAAAKATETQGAEALASAAASAVQDVTTGWIPLRSVVRRLTGAEKNANELKAAVRAGDLRRAYLKGLGLERGCAYPAAPMPGPAPVAKADPSEAGPAPDSTTVPVSQPVAPAQPAAASPG